MDISSLIASVKQTALDKAQGFLKQLTGDLTSKLTSLVPSVPKIPTPSSMDLKVPDFSSLSALLPTLPSIPTITLPNIDIPSITLPNLPTIPSIPTPEDLLKMVPVTLPSIPSPPTLPSMPSMPKLSIPPVEAPTANTLLPDPTTTKSPMDDAGVNTKAQIAINGEAKRQELVKVMISDLQTYFIHNVSSSVIPKLQDLQNIYKELADKSLHPTTESGWKAKFEELDTKNRDLYFALKNRKSEFTDVCMKCLNPNLKVNPEYTSIWQYDILPFMDKHANLLKAVLIDMTNQFDLFSSDYWYPVVNNIKAYVNEYGYAMWKSYDTKYDIGANFNLLYLGSISPRTLTYSKHPEYSIDTLTTFSKISYVLDTDGKIVVEALQKSLPPTDGTA